LNEKDNIEKIKKKYVYSFNIDNKNDDGWDNVESKLKEYVKIHDSWLGKYFSQ
jgi:hypothetical protein